MFSLTAGEKLRVRPLLALGSHTLTGVASMLVMTIEMLYKLLEWPVA
jgi:hypothetical protein